MLRKLPGKRPFERANLSLIIYRPRLLPLPLPQQLLRRRLALKVGSSKKPDYKYVCPREGSRTQRLYRAMLVRIPIHVTLTIPLYDLTIVSLALREVAEFLAGQTLSVDVETVMFAQHFPRQVINYVFWHRNLMMLLLDRKAFSRSDFSKSLRELGLTPSAVRAPHSCV